MAKVSVYSSLKIAQNLPAILDLQMTRKSVRLTIGEIENTKQPHFLFDLLRSLIRHIAIIINRKLYLKRDSSTPSLAKKNKQKKKKHEEKTGK